MKVICLLIATLAICTSEAFFPLRSGTSRKLVNPDRECVFGDQYHSVGESWHPNLGFPFGVMYCIRCDCVKHNTEDYISGHKMSKVMCHDVRKDCPTVTCQGAKVQRGECCKTCPQDTANEERTQSISKWDRFNAKSKQAFENTLNDEEVKIDESSSDKKYVALLTSTNGKSASYLARATFTVQRENLHFSIHHLKHSKPHTAQLIDKSGNVLFEHETKPVNEFRSITCGVWRNLPKNVFHHLEMGTLLLKVTARVKEFARNVTSQNHDHNVKNVQAVGKIASHRALQSETFSSLLNNENTGNGGAIAMITLGRNFKTIDYAVLFSVNTNEGRRRKSEQIIHINMELRNQNGDVIRKTDKKIPESQNEFADVWNSNSDMLRSLGKGSLQFAMEIQIGKRGTKQRFTGNITTVATCDLIQSVMSGSNCQPVTTTGSVGSALFRINSDNTVSYEITLSGLSSPVTSLQLNAFYRKRNRVLTDLTVQYHDGKAIGLMKEVSARELHILLSNDAWITVRTEAMKDCELRGNIALLLYSGHFARYKGMPIPLYGSLVVPPVETSAGGHAWVHLDEECHLHYEIVVSGLNKDIDSTVAAHLHGLAEIAGVEPTHKRLLKGFYGTEARGILKEIPDELYQIMNNGSAFLQVATKLNPSGEIRGQFRIPNKCISDSIPEEDIYAATLKHDKVVHDAPQRVVSADVRLEADPDSCYFEGMWQPNNSEWSPLYDEKCTSCACERGNVLCNPVMCPSLSCRRPVIVESECCPVCEDGLSSFMGKAEDDAYSIGSLFGMSNKKIPGINERRRSPFEKDLSHEIGGCRQDGDRRLHPRGSSWNPFIPPFGHVSCVTCTCHHNDQVTCEKVSCPPTPCENPVRKNNGDCCKVCPTKVRTYSDFPSRRDGWMQDGSNEGMCTFGRDIYSVGSTWSPNVRNLGKMSCITCSCVRDPIEGVVRKCVKKCPKIPDDCIDIHRSIKECCPKCARRALLS